jgi:plasmid segregation protein ParM
MHHELRSSRVDVRAIDVGYYNVKYTLGRKGHDGDQPIAAGMFPALAPRITTSVQMETPKRDEMSGCVVGVNGVDYFIGSDAALHATGLEPRPISDDYCRTDKYYALLCGALNLIAVDAGCDDLTISHLVLGLPLNTFPKHRSALTARATGEHVIGGRDGAVRRITVERASVIVQPQGTLTNFGVRHAKTLGTGWSLVVDPGGGTLDWYMARGHEPAWQRSGAYPRAMLACVNAIADQIDRDWRNQFDIVEKIDAALRNKAEKLQVGPREIPLKEYLRHASAVLEESVQHMLHATGRLDNLDRLLLTGGGASVYRDFIVGRYPQYAPIIRMDDDPVFSNVRGFHIAGELMMAERRAA